MKEDIKPCPFCGSTDLVEGSWYLDDTGADYEVEAWECNSCKAGAPKRIWNQRHEPTANVHQLGIPARG